MNLLHAIGAVALLSVTLIAFHIHNNRKGNVVKIKGDNNTTAGGNINGR